MVKSTFTSLKKILLASKIHHGERWVPNETTPSNDWDTHLVALEKNEKPRSMVHRII
jgi:hypothetical protein